MSLPRHFRTTEEDHIEYGCSWGRPGRKASPSGAAKQKRSEACRKRMSQAMKVQDAEERKRKFLEEALKAEEENRTTAARKSDGDHAK